MTRNLYNQFFWCVFLVKIISKKYSDHKRFFFEKKGTDFYFKHKKNREISVLNYWKFIISSIKSSVKSSLQSTQVIDSISLPLL